MIEILKEYKNFKMIKKKTQNGANGKIAQEAQFNGLKITITKKRFYGNSVGSQNNTGNQKTKQRVTS